MFAHACKIKLEGIISKLADAPYRSGRAKTWLKSKCGMEQEFVIIGWRPSDKPRRPFSSILLAVREDGKLRYAGRVGSGYSDERLEELGKKFKALARKTPPVDDVPPRHRAAARNSSSRSWSPKSNSAAGRMTVWCGRARSRDCAATSRRREVVKEVEMPKAKAVKGAKAEAKKSESDRPRSGASSDAERPTMARKRSPACASPIPTACSIRTRKSPSAS